MLLETENHRKLQDGSGIYVQSPFNVGSVAVLTINTHKLQHNALPVKSSANMSTYLLLFTAAHDITKCSLLPAQNSPVLLDKTHALWVQVYMRNI